ncbi:hypothetical protein [Streptomyces sp. NPDC021020]|uniref:hypothetical protein n=1 Tax=Streptomyces sp. NPDC021020 TaxID=3365109 RepID=UPI00379CCEA8
MARSRKGRAGRAAALGAVVAGLVLGGCSGGGHKGAEGLPDPAAGTVAAFDLDGLGGGFPLQRDVSDLPYGSHVAAGRGGAGYVAHRTASDGSTEILRLTSQGEVSRFASLGPGPTVFGLTALPDGSLAVGRGATLLRVTGKGAPAALPADHRFTGPVPIGARPDGSLVVLDAGQVWSVRDGHTSALTDAAGADGLGPGAVDGAGTAYVVPAGKNRLDAVRVVPPAGGTHALRVTGHLPGGSAPVSGLEVYTLAGAADGFYATAGTPDGTATYLIRVHGTAADVLAAFGAPAEAATCAAGHHYPALGNPCVMPYFALPLGDRVLLVGQSDGRAAGPALAVRAAPSPGA